MENEQTTAEKNKDLRAKRDDILRDIRILSTQASASVTARYLSDNGYKELPKDANDSDVWEAANDAFCNYGLELGECHRPARFPKMWQKLQESGACNLGVLLIATGGPEYGVLFTVANRKIAAAWYYYADWGTFDRVPLTKTQLQVFRSAYEDLVYSIDFVGYEG